VAFFIVHDIVEIAARLRGRLPVDRGSDYNDSSDNSRKTDSPGPERSNLRVGEDIQKSEQENQ
jgi:hypothetical protein